jgi:hypothetical protein
MIRKSCCLAGVCFLASFPAVAQTSPASAAAAAVWVALLAGSMDSTKYAHAENATIVRDRVRITLVDGTIQLAQPVNGLAFGAMFRGNGRLEIDPPNGIVERHMKRGMDLDSNHKMDWFFNPYVYGTGFPQCTFRVSVEPAPDGKTHVKGEVTRSGVPDSWKDVVPLYAHAVDKTTGIGNIGVTHSNEPIDAVLPIKVDRVTINEDEGLLADVHQ